jgi:hypothetical protein
VHLLRLLPLFFLATSWTSLWGQDKAELQRQVAELQQSVGNILGLPPKRTVAAEFFTKAQLTAFLAEQISASTRPEEILAEEFVLKRLGFAPQDFDLKATTEAVLNEQAAAFYDMRKRRLVMVTGAPMARISLEVLAHELAHAIADQHFSLQRFMKSANEEDDAGVARMAVMEGQATWLMNEISLRQRGSSLKDEPELVELMSQPAAPGAFPVLDAAPLYVRESLLFPYSAGMRFQHEVYLRRGIKAFREVFENPPLSSQQVLHPDLYFAGVKPQPLGLDKEKVPEHKPWIGGAFGELDHRILLQQYGEDSDVRVAAAWRGGEFASWRHRKTQLPRLMFLSAWADESAAEKIFALWKKILARRTKEFRVTKDGPERLEAETEFGSLRLSLQGARVRFEEGKLE